MRILVTNDDGIDSTGLHLLARAMRPHGDVIVAAPDTEYSGASAAIGALTVMQPQIERREIDGIDEAWSLTGPPALCVMFSRLGVFGDPFDLVVAGINPGANVGRSVYHSGTVGAAVTARIGGTHGIAVSQAVDNWGAEGQSWESMVANQKWESAAHVGSVVVGGFLSAPPADPVAINVNVPNLTVDQFKGWRRTEVAQLPARPFTVAALEPVGGSADTYDITMTWGEKAELPIETDTGAIEAGEVSITWLSRTTAESPAPDDATTAAMITEFGEAKT